MRKEEIPTPHPGHAQASARITAALGTLKYPIEKDAAADKVQKWRIPMEEQEVSLADILEHVPKDRFLDVADATKAVDQHWGRIHDLLVGAEKMEQEQKAKARKH